MRRKDACFTAFSRRRLRGCNLCATNDVRSQLFSHVSAARIAISVQRYRVRRKKNRRTIDGSAQRSWIALPGHISLRPFFCRKSMKTVSEDSNHYYFRHSQFQGATKMEHLLT